MQKKIDSSSDDFASWFAAASKKLDNDFDNASVLNELDRRIMSMVDGRLGWEIGERSDGTKFLAVSPGGDKGLLEFTRELAGRCSDVCEWSIEPAKPRKEWEGVFDFETSEGKLNRCRSADWKYMLYKFPDNTYDIVICAPELCPLDDDDRDCAAQIALDGYLGEEDRIQYIQGIDVLVSCDSETEKNASRLFNIFDHFSQLKTSDMSR